MQLIRCSALFPALIASMFAWPSSLHAAQSTARWYDAYQQGVAAVRKGDWATAEKLLLQAKNSGQKPGRRVFTYGDNYIAFLPDYYLGVVYLNTNRNAQAENAFKLVRDMNLITAKDQDYATFERQSREATFNRAFGEAVQASTSGNITVATERLAEARATNFNNTKVQDLSKQIADASAKSAPTPAATTAQTSPQPAQPVPQPVPPVPAPTTSVQSTPPAVTSNPVAINPGKVPSSAGARPPNATVPVQGVIQPKAPPSSPYVTPLREGVLAFFKGDYRDAIPSLQNAAQQPGAPPRARVLLACARVGLALVGGGDAAILKQAQSDFQAAGLQQYVTAADRRFISPKILQQLERR